MPRRWLSRKVCGSGRDVVYPYLGNPYRLRQAVPGNAKLALELRQVFSRMYRFGRSHCLSPQW